MKQLKGFDVFIASPGSLDVYRKAFVRVLHKYNDHHGAKQGIVYTPVGWDFNTTGGIVRAQSEINEALYPCDYFVMVLADRWGSPTGAFKPNGEPFKSGVEEEFFLAWELYSSTDCAMKNMLILFKDLPRRRLNEVNEQLASVLAFRKDLTEKGRVYYKRFNSVVSFERELEAALIRWNDDGHVKAPSMRLDRLKLMEQFPHPWLNGTLLRNLFNEKPGSIWLGIDQAWRRLKTDSVDQALGDLADLARNNLVARLELARMYGLTGSTETAQQVALECYEEHSKEAHEGLNQLGSALTFADLLLAYGDAAKACELYLQCIDGLTDEAHKTARVEVLCRIGRSYRRLAELSDEASLAQQQKEGKREPSPIWMVARDWYEKARVLVESDHALPRSYHSVVLYGLGHVHYGMREYTAAETLFRMVQGIESRPSGSLHALLRAMRSLVWSRIMNDERPAGLAEQVKKLISDAKKLADEIKNVYEKVLLIEAEAMAELYRLEGGPGGYRAAITKYEEARDLARSSSYPRRAARIEGNIRNLQKYKDYDFYD